MRRQRSSALRPLATLAALLLPACGDDGGAPAAPAATLERRAPTRPLVVELPADDAARLASWAWDGAPPVHVAGASGPLALDARAAGRTPTTLRYLPLDEGGGEALHDAGPDRERHALDGWRWTTVGRFGAALERDPEAPPLGLLAAGELAVPFAVELWVRPEPPLRAGVLADVAGGPRLELLSDGRVRVADAEGGPLLAPADARLEAGRWSRVALAVDGPELPAVRLAVDDRAWGRAASVALAPPGDEPGAAVAIGDAVEGGRGFAGGIDDVRVEARAPTTAELLEAFAPPLEPGEHALALAFADGEERAVAAWSGLVERPALDTAEAWAAGDREHVAADADGARWTPGHWERDRAFGPPLARTTHPTLHLGDGRVWLYGGETRDTHFPPMRNTDDTWLYHAHERRWERLALDVRPPGRCHQPAAFAPELGLVLLAGGYVNERPEKVQLDDTWLFHADELRWERREPGGVDLPALSDSGLVWHAGARRFLLFAVRRAFAYDPEMDRWDRLPPARAVDADGAPVDWTPPGSPIVGYDDATGLVVLFGGVQHAPDGARAYRGETAVYDWRENLWRLRDPVDAPSPRVRAGFARDERRGRFVLFGGVQDQSSEREDDLWSYDVGADRWTRHEASNPPSRRGGYYGMAYVRELDRFVLVCGRHAKERFLNEAWRLHLDERAEGRATWVFDRAGFADRERWHAAWEAPEGSAVRFRFAGSADGRAWGPWSDVPADAVDAAARFVKVEATLVPGEAGRAPALRALGFGPLPDLAPELRRREDPVAPLSWS